MGSGPPVLINPDVIDDVAQTAPSRFTAHVPGMGITVGIVPEKDTGGER